MNRFWLIVLAGLTVAGALVIADRSDDSNGAQAGAAVAGAIAVAVTLIQVSSGRETVQAQIDAELDRTRLHLDAERGAALRAELVKVRAPSVERLSEAMSRITLTLQASHLRVAVMAGAVAPTMVDATKTVVQNMQAEVLGSGTVAALNAKTVTTGLWAKAVRDAAQKWFDTGQRFAALAQEFDIAVEAGKDPSQAWALFDEGWKKVEPEWDAASEQLAAELERYASAQDQEG